jgi:drug/metabolite transporter (DMT)-like permease
MKDSSRTAIGLGLAAVICWSTVATAFKIALQHLDIFQLLFIACTTSAMVLTAGLAWQGRLGALKIGLISHWRLTLIVAALNPTLYYLILFSAYERLPAQIAQPINYTWAIVLTIMSVIILKRPITSRDILATAICYAGVVIITSNGSLDLASQYDSTGIALALLSTLLWAGYWIINMQDERDAAVALALNFLVATPACLVLCLAFSSLSFKVQGLAAGIYVGVFEMSVAFLLWSGALRHSSNTSRVSNLIFLSPFLSLLFISQLLGEEIRISTIAGLMTIVTGLLLQQWRAIRAS